MRESGIDICWDNVGGETLEATLEAAKECGMIAGYNSGGAPIKSITISGFIVGRLESNWGKKFLEEVAPKVASGEIKHREHIYEGLDKLPQAILEA
ncbi:hypothetical protein BJ165DRAFT_1530948 [Panaeolus papilionaceus]|nr:hypothetical protein BJ165DRAFT_1530948 [Panaeolus papilionaceus]